MTLRAYLVNAIERLRAAPSLDLFLDLRYRDLARAFPHAVFSVGQATPDFFERALAHLNGEPFDDKSDEKPSEYEANYRRWIASHR